MNLPLARTLLSDSSSHIVYMPLPATSKEVARVWQDRFSAYDKQRLMSLGAIEPGLLTIWPADEYLAAIPDYEANSRLMVSTMATAVAGKFNPLIDGADKKLWVRLAFQNEKDEVAQIVPSETEAQILVVPLEADNSLHATVADQIEANAVDMLLDRKHGKLVLVVSEAPFIVEEQDPYATDKRPLSKAEINALRRIIGLINRAIADSMLSMSANAGLVGLVGKVSVPLGIPANAGSKGEAVVSDKNVDLSSVDAGAVRQNMTLIEKQLTKQLADPNMAISARMALQEIHQLRMEMVGPKAGPADIVAVRAESVAPKHAATIAPKVNNFAAPTVDTVASNVVPFTAPVASAETAMPVQMNAAAASQTIAAAVTQVAPVSIEAANYIATAQIVSSDVLPAVAANLSAPVTLVPNSVEISVAAIAAAQSNEVQPVATQAAPLVSSQASSVIEQVQAPVAVTTENVQPQAVVETLQQVRPQIAAETVQIVAAVEQPQAAAVIQVAVAAETPQLASVVEAAQAAPVAVTAEAAQPQAAAETQQYAQQPSATEAPRQPIIVTEASQPQQAAVEPQQLQQAESASQPVVAQPEIAAQPQAEAPAVPVPPTAEVQALPVNQPQQVEAVAEQPVIVQQQPAVQETQPQQIQETRNEIAPLPDHKPTEIYDFWQQARPGDATPSQALPSVGGAASDYGNNESSRPVSSFVTNGQAPNAFANESSVLGSREAGGANALPGFGREWGARNGAGSLAGQENQESGKLIKGEFKKAATGACAGCGSAGAACATCGRGSINNLMKAAQLAAHNVA